MAIYWEQLKSYRKHWMKVFSNYNQCHRHSSYYDNVFIRRNRFFSLISWFKPWFYRFIGPFLNVVQHLEQSLTALTNVLDEWTAVQSKWLYLEGVFIGGDIREQLPDEAKKFDDIDRYFIKVSISDVSVWYNRSMFQAKIAALKFLLLLDYEFLCERSSRFKFLRSVWRR